MILDFETRIVSSYGKVYWWHTKSIMIH